MGSPACSMSRAAGRSSQPSSVELPDRYETLLFLGGREPVFMGTQVAVTRRCRRLRDFVLQIVWCMFAEDLTQSAVAVDIVSKSLEFALLFDKLAA